MIIELDILSDTTAAHTALEPVTHKQTMSSVPFAALQPKTPFSSRLSARSALYDRFRILLASGDRSLERSKYRDLVVKNNILGLKTMASRIKTWDELGARYILNGEDDRFAAFWAEWQRCRSEAERGLTAYILFALNDRLVFELGLTLLYPLLRLAPRELRVDDVLQFLRTSEARHPEAAKWSEQTRLAVAQKYTASIRDFGLARGAVRKTTIRPALYPAPTRLLLRALQLGGRAPLEIVHAEEFRLLGIDPREGLDALEALKARGDLQLKVQADVVELHLDGR